MRLAGARSLLTGLVLASVVSWVPAGVAAATGAHGRQAASPGAAAQVAAQAPKPGDGAVPACIYDPLDFANAFLDELGEPDTRPNVEAILGWEEAEGGNWENDARFNPLDTTYVLDGSSPMNGVGVQAYSSWSIGLQATVLTIDNGLYGGILAALAKADDPVAVARAVGASAWGTPDYEDLLPPSYDPPGPAWEHFCVSDGTFIRVGADPRVYVVAGDAPLAVTSWTAVGGRQPIVEIDAARMATMQQVPSAWTLLCAGLEVYEIAGGAPVYVSSFEAIGGPRPCVHVDPQAILRAGGAAPFDHLLQYPVDGTLLEAGVGGARYVVEHGVPEFVVQPKGVAVLVDPGSIAREGQPSPFDHLLSPVGYRLAAADGSIFSVGELLAYGAKAEAGQSDPVVGVVSTPDGGGYLEVTRNGTVSAFGDASYLGDLPARHVHAADIVALARTPDGAGYWLIGKDGGIFAFGDARYCGSLPGIGARTDDVVGIVPAPTGTGYLLVGSDGGVFAFGRGARFHGSLPSLGIRVDDVRAILTAPAETGYLLVAADGGTFALGVGARFEGSLPGRGIVVSDVVGLALTDDSRGYWMATASGGVYAFGDAPVLRPPPALSHHLPVAAISGA
jgi:hypothetical protein